MWKRIKDVISNIFLKDGKIFKIINDEKNHLYDHLDIDAKGNVHIAKGVSIFVLIAYILYQIVYFCWYAEFDCGLYYLIPVLVFFSIGFIYDYLYHKGYIEFLATKSLVLMHVLMVGLTFWLDCFTPTSFGQIYTPLVLTVGPIMFFHSIKIESIIEIFTLILYLIAAWLNITPIAPEHAIIQAVLTFLIGMLNILIVANMRYSINESAKNLDEEIKAREKIEYASEVAEALSYDFLNVYSIDLENKTCRIIKLDGYVTQGFDSTDYLIDYPYEDMIETYIQNRVHPDERERLSNALTIEHVQEMLKNNKAYIEAYRILDDHGEHYCQFRFVRIGSSKRIIAGFRNVDATMRYDKEQRIALREALNVAKQASEAKTNFLNGVSHDIRTPMNAILGFHAHAQAHLDNQSIIQESLDQIKDSSQQLLKYIDTVLDASRVQTIVDTNLSIYSLKSLINELLNEANAIANSKNITITVDDSKVLEDKVKVNKDRFHQVIFSVLENAILYTPNGGKIDFAINPGSNVSANKKRYVFTVTDNGVGMSEDFLQHVFDPFSREHDTTHSGIAGAGLGLIIVKNILESTGGGIFIQSEEGIGTKVTMIAMLNIVDDNSIDFKTDESKNNNEKDFSRFKGMHVLVVDDNELNREIAVGILSQKEILGEAASSGEEAIKMFNESSLGYYKVILLDILMPEMDGFETAKNIRKLNRIDAKNIPFCHRA